MAAKPGRSRQSSSQHGKAQPWHPFTRRAPPERVPGWLAEGGGAPWQNSAHVHEVLQSSGRTERPSGGPATQGPSPTQLAHSCPPASHSRVVHVLGAWEGLQRPVEEAVEEDEACTAGPNQQDEDEGGAQVVDHLGSRRSRLKRGGAEATGGGDSWEELGP